MDVLASLKVRLIPRLGRFLTLRTWLEKTPPPFPPLMASRFRPTVHSGTVRIRLCRATFGRTPFPKCIRMDLGTLSGTMLAVVVNVIRLEFVGKETLTGKWARELLLALMALGSSTWPS